MSVTLAKSSDKSPASTLTFYRAWLVTYGLHDSLTSNHGDARGDSLYEGLADNDLTVLRDVFPHVTYPTLVKGQSHVTEHASPVDYSDGYGHQYSKGE
jgi:hypothetical protein